MITECFDFIEYAIGSVSCLSEKAKQMNLTKLKAFAQKQAVTGLVADAITHLKDNEINASQKDVMYWVGVGVKMANKNRLLNQRCVELSEIYRKGGFRSCVLKGQGNALMYPNALSRTPGDIDLWVEGNRNDIIKFTAEHAKLGFEQYHHIDADFFKDVPVEIHFTPSKIAKPTNRRWQNMVKEMADEQFSNRVALPEGFGVINVPTDYFNLLFQLTHIRSHFFSEGIGLRHFIDYYFLLKKDYTSEQKSRFQNDLRWLGLTKFAAGVIWVEKEALGLDDAHILLAPNEEIGRLMLDDLVTGGNFGHYNPIHNGEKMGLLRRGMSDWRRDLSFLHLFPTDVAWYTISKIANQRWKIRKWVRSYPKRK